jgi:hypothetical protein
VGQIFLTQVTAVRSHFGAYLGATKPVSRRKKCQVVVVPKRVDYEAAFDARVEKRMSKWFARWS